VHSARFAGEAATDQENNEKLLHELAAITYEKRTARFSCCIAFCCPDGKCVTFTGQLAGSIIEEPRGNNGFGYDPLFQVTGYNKTLAELDMSIKNSISHRAKAFRRFTDYLSRGNI
jgi:XTP/dITP diphosphohydrolase